MLVAGDNEHGCPSGIREEGPSRRAAQVPREGPAASGYIALSLTHPPTGTASPTLCWAPWLTTPPGNQHGPGSQTLRAGDQAAMTPSAGPSPAVSDDYQPADPDRAWRSTPERVQVVCTTFVDQVHAALGR